jgi:hypothetical protein
LTHFHGAWGAECKMEEEKLTNGQKVITNKDGLVNTETDNSVSSTGMLDYSIPYLPDNVHEILMQKSNGKFYLVVWGEQYSGGSNNVSIELSSTCSSLNIYDPTLGTSAIETLNNISSITITVTDHPLIIEI